MSYTSGITNSPLLQTLMTQTDGVSPARTGRTQSIGTPAAQDSAALSTAASALQQTGMEDTGRAEKVQALQAAVASGTYRVPAGAVADKLMQTLLQR